MTSTKNAIQRPSPTGRALPCHLPRFDDYERAPVALVCKKGGILSNSPRRNIECALVSVITVVRNSVTTLSRTIESIKAQVYPRVEYLIVDGGSIDGTLDVIRRYESDVDLWVSDPDHGISDAFNKGIALSAGQFVALVNADDWIEPDHIWKAVETLTHTGADFAFGNLTVHGRDGHELYSVIGDRDYARCLHHAMTAVNHPTVVCRRSVFELNGLFDPRFRVAMDYEWLLRNHTLGIVGALVPNLTSHMSADGMSQTHVRQSLREVRLASVQYGYSPALAATRYYLRRSRAWLRHLLEQCLPKSFLDALRATLNSSYRGISSRSSTND